MISDLDVPYDQLANFDCTRDNLMLLFSGEKEKKSSCVFSISFGIYGVRWICPVKVFSIL